MFMVVLAKIKRFGADQSSLVRKIYLDAVFYFFLNFRALRCSSFLDGDSTDRPPQLYR